jgi:hypothetical protein
VIRLPRLRVIYPLMFLAASACADAWERCQLPDLIDRFPGSASELRPPWMTDQMSLALVEGYYDLEVVGESHYQDNLWRIMGGRGKTEVHVRIDVYAMLVAEDDNPYDVNAVAVWVQGLKVGHLSRTDAARLRPGLLSLQEEHSQPIALEGVIVGGGIREDGPGRLGVFLTYDPEAFGLPGPETGPWADERLRRALGPDLATSKPSPYDLVWMHGLADDDARGIKTLRDALARESDIIGRHFIYAELEAALYRCRDVFGSALDEYDEVCGQHDAEMDQIRGACIAYWGKVPAVDTYKQQAIRQQKRHDYTQALRWAERGLAVYGDEAARPEAVQDLSRRAAKYGEKLAT